MEELISQIRKALDSHLFYLALFATLSLPDICGALETNGDATGDKYEKWFDTNVSHKFSDGVIKGLDIYKYRCSFFHQGLSVHPDSRYSRIIFKEPILSPGIILADPQRVGPPNEKKALFLELKPFCEHVLGSVEDWYSSKKDDPVFIDNYKKFMKRRTLDEFGIRGIFGIT